MALKSLNQLRASAENMVCEVDRVEGIYKNLAADIENLENLGIINAAPHWREKKYLYLVHPFGAFTKQVDGATVPFRKREYIGLESSKTIDALEKIERYGEWLELSQQMNSLCEKFDNLNTRMDNFFGEIEWIKRTAGK